MLVAGANGARETGIVGPVIFVPKGLATADTLGKDFELFAGTGRGLGGLESFVRFRGEILVVTVFEDRLENVLKGGIRHDIFSP